jgi:hypothetical protein
VLRTLSQPEVVDGVLTIDAQVLSPWCQNASDAARLHPGLHPGESGPLQLSGQEPEPCVLTATRTIGRPRFEYDDARDRVRARLTLRLTFTPSAQLPPHYLRDLANVDVS